MCQDPTSIANWNIHLRKTLLTPQAKKVTILSFKIQQEGYN